MPVGFSLFPLSKNCHLHFFKENISAEICILFYSHKGTPLLYSSTAPGTYMPSQKVPAEASASSKSMLCYNSTICIVCKRSPPMISIVTPVYNEEDNVIFFHDAVTRVMEETGMAYELIYVDDGSHDRTNELICGLAEKDPHVRALTFARNFGHQIAITCGMDFARGDAVITMDGDMQHPPALIPTLIGKWKEGYDIVQTVRTATEDAGPIKKITSAGYYTIINSISKTPVLPGGSDFRLMDRKALDVFLKFREHSRFIRGIVGGLGFKTASVKFEAPARHAGVSKFNMRKMLHFAVDGILTNSTTPLRAAFYAGIFAGIAGIILILHVLYAYLTGAVVPGWTTLTILVSFFGTVNLVGLGIIGEYIGRIYEESKNRPLYWLSGDTGSTEKIKKSRPEVSREIKKN